MRVASVIVSLFLLALSFVACGGSDPQAKDRERIEAVTARFAAAVRGKDAAAFCKVLAPEEKKRLRYEGRRCLVAWGPRHNLLFKAKEPDLTLEEVTEVKPPNATAKLANGGRLVLLQEGGTWYVNLSPQK